jgi:hypothetical protein
VWLGIWLQRKVCEHGKFGRIEHCLRGGIPKSKATCCAARPAKGTRCRRPCSCGHQLRAGWGSFAAIGPCIEIGRAHV